MRDGQAGLGHPPWEGEGGGGSRKGFFKGPMLVGLSSSGCEALPSP